MLYWRSEQWQRGNQPGHVAAGESMPGCYGKPSTGVVVSFSECSAFSLWGYKFANVYLDCACVRVCMCVLTANPGSHTGQAEVLTPASHAWGGGGQGPLPPALGLWAGCRNLSR